MARIVGVDFGLRRIGFAVSDTGEIIATPLSMTEVRNIGEALKAVVVVCGEQAAERIVIGLPLNMDGTDGPMAQEVRRFSDRLARNVSIPIDLWDERLSSKTAESVLIEAGTSRKKRKRYIDKLAAQVMLQHYLDARSGGADEAWNDDVGE